MKKITQLLLASLTILFSCSNSNAGNETTKEKTAVASNSNDETSKPSPGNDLIGDWKLSVETYDENQNKKLDPQERAKAFSNHFFFRFNADGSALVNFSATAERAFKAKYKLSKRKDLQFISIYIDGDENEGPDGLSGGYYIISVDKNELVVLEGANERAIWIFKKS
jgi:hypothetical protein